MNKAESDEDKDWTCLSLSSFAKDWDNEQDAIYDRWRELYNVPENL